MNGILYWSVIFFGLFLVKRYYGYRRRCCNSKYFILNYLFVLVVFIGSGSAATDTFDSGYMTGWVNSTGQEPYVYPTYGACAGAGQSAACWMQYNDTHFGVLSPAAAYNVGNPNYLKYTYRSVSSGSDNFSMDILLSGTGGSAWASFYFLDNGTARKAVKLSQSGNTLTGVNFTYTYNFGESVFDKWYRVGVKKINNTAWNITIIGNNLAQINQQTVTIADVVVGNNRVAVEGSYNLVSGAIFVFDNVFYGQDVPSVPDPVCERKTYLLAGNTTVVNGTTFGYTGVVESWAYPGYYIDVIYTVAGSSYRANWSSSPFGWPDIVYPNWTVHTYALYANPDAVDVEFCNYGTRNDTVSVPESSSAPVTVIVNNTVNVTIPENNLTRERQYNNTGGIGNITGASSEISDVNQTFKNVNYTVHKQVLTAVTVPVWAVIPAKVMALATYSLILTVIGFILKGRK